MITVIISVFNEMKNAYLSQILAGFKTHTFFEVLCVDGGSTDGTIEWIQQQGVAVDVLPKSSRAARLNHGIQAANTMVVLLQHPRSIISSEGLLLLKEKHQELKWAAFTHQFDERHYFLKFISWYSNQVRVKRKSIVYLDHCIFINQKFVRLDPIPDLAVFEDTALSNALSSQCKPSLLSAVVTTSAIRFLDRGIYKHFFLNQWIKILYLLKMDSCKINRIYEKKLNLNQEN